MADIAVSIVMPESKHGLMVLMHIKTSRLMMLS